MAIKRWNANTSTWELVGTPGTVTPAAIGAAALVGNNTFTGSLGVYAGSGRIMYASNTQSLPGSDDGTPANMPFGFSGNFSNGAAEMNIWNTVNLSGSGDGGKGFTFIQKTGSSTYEVPLRINGNGMLYQPDILGSRDTGLIRRFNTPHISSNRGARFMTGLDDGSFTGMIVNNIASNNSAYNSQYIMFTVHEGGVALRDAMFINQSGNIGMSSSFFTVDAKLHIASVSSLARGMQISLTDGAFAGDGVLLVASRSSTSSFNYLRARSDGSADNEFILRGDGTGYSDGGWTTPAADYAEYFEWADGNINDDDRRGYTVSLVNNKIKIAEEGEDVIGVVSANPSFVGDAHNDHWQGKYILDDFGSEIQESYEVITWIDEKNEKHGYEVGLVPEGIEIPEAHNIITQYRSILNPSYDPNQEYIGRENRKEWDTIGIVGKLRIRKGQIVNPRWIKMRDISTDIEEWFIR